MEMVSSLVTVSSSTGHEGSLIGYDQYKNDGNHMYIIRTPLEWILFGRMLFIPPIKFMRLAKSLPRCIEAKLVAQHLTKTVWLFLPLICYPSGMYLTCCLAVLETQGFNINSENFPFLSVCPVSLGVKTYLTKAWGSSCGKVSFFFFVLEIAYLFIFTSALNLIVFVLTRLAFVTLVFNSCWTYPASLTSYQLFNQLLKLVDHLFQWVNYFSASLLLN